jgi:hypothetical protein
MSEVSGFGVISFCGVCGGLIYSLIPTGALAPCTCCPDDGELAEDWE